MEQEKITKREKYLFLLNLFKVANFLLVYDLLILAGYEKATYMRTYSSLQRKLKAKSLKVSEVKAIVLDWR